MARTNRRRENNVDDKLDRKRKLSTKKVRGPKKQQFKKIDLNNLSVDNLEELDEMLDEY